MSEEKDRAHGDTKLLSNAIIGLNVSLRNVSIYPRNHPIVEDSLNRAFESLQQLLEMQREITIAVAKDTLIVDDHQLDKQNCVFNEFALSLNRLNIAFIKLLRGLNRDELYSFHRFLLTETSGESSEELQAVFNEHKLVHIKTEFINYSAFKLAEEPSHKEGKERSLWEEYVYDIIAGKLEMGSVFDVIEKIPEGKLAELLNAAVPDKDGEESFSNIASSYIKKFIENELTGKELLKIANIAIELRPDLKQQFLSSATQALAGDLPSTEKAMGDLSVSEVINLLSTINQYMVSVPDGLRNLLDQFSRIDPKTSPAPRYDGSIIEDDILLSTGVTDLLSESAFKSFVSGRYQQEIEQLISFDTKKAARKFGGEYDSQWSDEHIERDFNQIVLEMALSGRTDLIPQQDCEHFIGIVKEQIEQFASTGQYAQVLKTLEVFETGLENKRLDETSASTLEYFRSPEFIASLVESFRIMGRQMRDDALLLCDYYGDSIIHALIDTLIEEESPAVRRFFISLIQHFREKAMPVVIRHLDDDRWFVKRNMLFILLECGSDKSLRQARPLCDHKDPRVSFEAIKCLIKTKDEYGIEALKNNLNSGIKENIKKAVEIAGALSVKEVVPDLISMLEKKSRSKIDFEDKVTLVRALGQIGDTRAADVLNGILSSRALIFRVPLKKLKGEAEKALNNLPSKNN